MPPADFFRRFGLFVEPTFVTANECASLRTAMRAAATASAEVRVRGSEYAVDVRVRRVEWADIRGATTQVVHARLSALRPRLEAHFGLALGECGKLGFLLYRVGSFYAPHTDSSDEPDADPVVRMRRVSVIIFLNHQTLHPHPDGFVGGELALYGLLEDPRGESAGLPLAPIEGLLVAFRSDTYHSVQPVTHGERYTVVTWFNAAAQ